VALAAEMTATTALTPGDDLGIVFCASELFLSLSRRSKATGVSKDRGSLWMLWAVIAICIFLARTWAFVMPGNGSAFLRLLQPLGEGLVVLGLILRWGSILYLGRSFTVDVSIAAGQKVVDTGPYRLIRHPSYTGALIAFLGLGILFNDWVSLGILMVPIVLAFLRRISIEETALKEGLGEDYIAYCARTKRLVPWIY
jgi:protein-S-isoprenylcysteine O-methyltransferase